MNYIKKLIIILLLLFPANVAQSNEIYFIDFKLILNESSAGKKAQNFLKSKLDNGIKNLRKKEKSIQEEEKKNYTTKEINYS